MSAATTLRCWCCSNYICDSLLSSLTRRRRKIEMLPTPESPTHAAPSTPNQGGFFTPRSTPHQHHASAIYTGGKRRRANTNTNFNGLLDEKHVESDLTNLGERLPAVRGDGGERDLEAVVAAMVVQGSDTPNVVGWMKGSGWGDGGHLIHDLNRGLMEWIRRGGRAGGGRGRELVGGVRRGMGILARRVKEMEMREGRDKAERSQKRDEVFQLKQMNLQLKANLKSANESNADLEDRSEGLAKEVLESVPHSKFESIKEDLLQEKKMHTAVLEKYAKLQTQYAEQKQGRDVDKEVIETVKAELDRTHDQLDEKISENVRLRAESEARSDGNGGVSAAVAGGKGGKKKNGKKK